LLVIFWLMRLFDVFVIAKVFSFPSGMRGSHLLGVLCDTYFVLKVAGILLLPYLLLALLRMQIAQGLFIFLGVLMVLANLVLQIYFATAKTMLEPNVFEYSLPSVYRTLAATNSFSGENIVLLIAFPVLYVAIHHYAGLVRMPNFAYYIFYSAVAVVLLTSGYSVASAKSFSSSFESSLVTNKVGYFTQRTLDYLTEIERIERASIAALPERENDVLPDSGTDYGRAFAISSQNKPFFLGTSNIVKK
jgi:hypothetical protein